MQVVGGTYLEHIYEPYWYELFGSGLRAASFISSLSGSISLSTYLCLNEISSAVAKSHTFDIKLDIHERNQPICFNYFHGLSCPQITPNIIQIQKEKPIEIDVDECTLRFGMVEGDCIVKGNTVVYDPQSAFHPVSFNNNGSFAKNRLALILNSSEAFYLSRKSSIESAGKSLLDEQKIDVVVIKRGPLGCLVFTKNNINAVDAYKTDQVFPIGSGDVFAAVFTHYWGEKEISAVEAADHASFASAYYCNSQITPLPANFYNERARFAPVRGSLNGKQVYLAGPFFTTAQRWLIEECVQAIRGFGIKSFSPYHEVGSGPGDEIYSKDIEGLKMADAVLACLDGLDAGTVYEIGFARAIGKPVVVFVQNEGEEDLKMIAGSGCIICNDLVTALYQIVWALMEL